VSRAVNRNNPVELSVIRRTAVLARVLRRRVHRLVRDERGLSAVEFAMLLPLMLALYLGAVEISQAIGADRKVTLTARTVADLISQVPSINNADMSNSLNASAAVMAPYPANRLKVTISSLSINAEGRATVAWSDTLNGTARARGADVTIPSALAVPNSSLILSEVEYSYTPTIGYVITGSLSLKDQIYMRPRLSTSVGRTAS
jgi:Flp pilus assembly protein TadG